jgi:hypothetical protein
MSNYPFKQIIQLEDETNAEKMYNFNEQHQH